ncbi:TonB-dependent receptor [Rhodanobacter sp. L36]|uniref:TonB-dependent receptor domain-containing protein n=1 Tax=Rhodanobacter sp. L36 TaxID=1747221 RepID=UPI00131AAE53|nr:TonB-dependent receptor [Rhodanobacter sp. L36]
MIRTKITVAIVAALALGCSTAYAQSSAPQDASQDNSGQAPDSTNAKKLQAVTVTGSLIPQTEIETATPVITITAQDMKAKGFTTVAQALQQASFSTGSVQGMQDTNSFTTGAETLSLFGLPVGFTKYLIDGRPMGNFPGLYNGSDTFNSISGLPIDMVDHIDILPGGQSSLYGSDAIAGVINIVLKKHIDAPTIDVRYGWDKGGGGANRRISLADSFTFGKFTSLVGLQFDSTQPVWSQDRALTRGYFQQGTSPGIPLRDSLAYQIYSNDVGPESHYIQDPNNCQALTGLWGGTTAQYSRNPQGNYCGSPNAPAGKTLSLDSKSANLYTHNTFDVNDNVQLYGDLLYNYSEDKSSDGGNTTFWSPALVAGGNTSGYFWDPSLDGGSIVTLQHTFAPEEVGGYQNIMSKQYEKAYMLSFGAHGTFGQSNWDYDLGFTHSDDHLENLGTARVASEVEGYYKNHVLGPQQGTYSGYPVFTPNYANFFKPISVADFDSFTTRTKTVSKTWDNLVRGQLTNASLFHLPGGDAGIAVVVEGGNEGFDITPDPRLLENTTVDYGNGNVYTTPYIWGQSATPGAGHRSRAAATAELRLPLLEQLTADVSGRYDNYDVSGKNIGAGTYNLGLEYRPVESLLLRARYGTAFKVPTLSDEFQRPSGYFSGVTDYLNCARLGFVGSTLGNCPDNYGSTQFKGETVGNPDLQPIKAKVWSYGIVWAPVQGMSMSVDYLHWDINNEVSQLSPDTLSNTEYLCDIGTIDPSTATCANAFNLITRGTAGKLVNGVQLLGPITDITTTKLNIANEQDNAISANFNYGHDIGSFGKLVFDFSYSDLLKHTSQDYAIDPAVDLLTHPGYSTDFKSKANASLTWLKNEWSATLYVNRFGRTPNYQATQSDSYVQTAAYPLAGKLPAWIYYNASVTFNPIHNLALSLQISNLFNKMPPLDRSYPGTTAVPYNTDDYNPYGRAMFIEANYKFGQGS